MAVTVVTMEVGNDGVAVISISNPPLNVLTVASKLLRIIFASPGI